VNPVFRHCDTREACVFRCILNGCGAFLTTRQSVFGRGAEAVRRLLSWKPNPGKVSD
jgi:hypothetical protein